MVSSSQCGRSDTTSASRGHLTVSVNTHHRTREIGKTLPSLYANINSEFIDKRTIKPVKGGAHERKVNIAFILSVKVNISLQKMKNQNQNKCAVKADR